MELNDYLLKNNIDVALITETWLKENIKISLRGASLYRTDRPIQLGGVTAIAVRNGIIHQDLPKIDNAKMEFTRVQIKENFLGTIQLVAIYKNQKAIY